MVRIVNLGVNVVTEVHVIQKVGNVIAEVAGLDQDAKPIYSYKLQKVQHVTVYKNVHKLPKSYRL